MVTFFEARELAKSFTKEEGEILPEVFYGIGEEKEYTDCFYFDFLLVDKGGNMLKEPIMIGGAPGITVDKKTGEVQIITFGQLTSLI